MQMIAPADLDRFRADLARLHDSGRLALAVSGGADSMALLRLAHAALPGQIIAATVDHRLRAAAAEEAAMVAAHCAALGVPHIILTPATPPAGASIQARAVIAGFPVLRPLLGWRRAELRRIATEAGAPFVDDPSNADPRHDRTRFRTLLAATPALDPVALARSATALGEAEAALAFASDRLWAERAAGDAPLTLDVNGLPREFRRRLARRAISETRARHAIAVPEWSDAANIEPLLDSLAAGTSATQAGVMLTPHGDIWTVTKAPPRRSA